MVGLPGPVPRQPSSRRPLQPAQVLPVPGRDVGGVPDTPQEPLAGLLDVDVGEPGRGGGVPSGGSTNVTPSSTATSGVRNRSDSLSTRTLSPLAPSGRVRKVFSMAARPVSRSPPRGVYSPSAARRAATAAASPVSNAATNASAFF